MALNTIFDWFATPGSNTDVAGNGIQGSSNLSLGNDVFQNILAQVASGAVSRGSDVATSGTLDFTAVGVTTKSLLHDLTGTTTVTAVTLTAGQWRLCRAQGVFQITASATLIVNGSTSVNYTTTAGDLIVIFGYGSSTVRLWAFTGGAVTAATTSASGIVQLATPAEAVTGTDTAKALTAADIGQLGYALAASVSGNALTVSLKHVSGADPSASNPVSINFRNATAATGTPSPLSATAATSIVISSGSTMGFTSAVIGRLWVVAFNDAGTLRLGLVNALSGTSIMALRDGLYSSTAEGGVGAADSAQVIYTGTAVSSKAMTVLGYIEATEATAGTWATTPSLVKVWQPGDPLPGDTVQMVRNQTGSVATGTTLIPDDNTIPQITEGDQYMTQAVTPYSGANLLAVDTISEFSTGSGATFCVALFRDSTANAIAAMRFVASGSDTGSPCSTVVLASSTTATTFRTRIGSFNAGTSTFNGSGGGAKMGGSLASSMKVTELMA